MRFEQPGSFSSDFHAFLHLNSILCHSISVNSDVRSCFRTTCTASSLLICRFSVHFGPTTTAIRQPGSDCGLISSFWRLWLGIRHSNLFRCNFVFDFPSSSTYPVYLCSNQYSSDYSYFCIYLECNLVVICYQHLFYYHVYEIDH